MTYPRIAKVLGFTGAEFETQDGAISLSVDHMAALEAKLGDHSAKKEEWKTQRETLLSEHSAALAAANQKVLEAEAKVGEITTQLDQANAKIESLENDPADNTDPAQSGGEGAAGRDFATKYAFSAERFKNAGRKK